MNAGSDGARAEPSALAAATALAPTLKSARLLLRAPRASDLDASAAMWADPAVVKHVGGRPFTRSEVWARLLRYAGHWTWLGYGYWVVEERASGRYVGEVGFGDTKRELEPASQRYDGTPELGWALASWAHGRGFATEAVEQALAWSDRERDWPLVLAIIEPEHHASIRVAEKCGLRERASATLQGTPLLVFERRRAR